jgi:glutamate mutase epsilon subunit
MTNEELSKLEFPIATMKMLESTTAMLRTVLQNQMEIMKALNIGNHEIISAEVNRLLQENIAIVDGDLKRQNTIVSG